MRTESYLTGGMKSKGWRGASMSLAARAMRGARPAWRWVELPLLEALALGECQLVTSVEGGRKESVFSATPRSCITQRKVSSGVSV
jgi:hypothetical protein